MDKRIEHFLKRVSGDCAKNTQEIVKDAIEALSDPENEEALNAVCEAAGMKMAQKKIDRIERRT